MGYQKLGTFRLPHTGRMVFYSRRSYRFQETERAAVRPDVLIETDADACPSGIDQALDWIMADIENRM